MADIGKNLKTAWMKSMEAIGNTASNIASNTKYKVQEMNLINRRREILSDFGAQAYEMWQKGEQFPEKLSKQLEELSHVDEELNAMRTERLAGVTTDKVAAEGTAAEAPTQEEAPAEADKAEECAACTEEPKAEVPTIEVTAEEPADAHPLTDDDVPTLQVPEDHPEA
ncbi:MAG: hypothetical protein Q4B32_08610 [Clostridia bacterium]|nr:hypothetical protein [Clostridia bacterium]